MPKVSINILTKNRAELLKKALFSLQKQSFKDFEVVAVNDGSNDNTKDVIKSFLDLNLKVINHHKSFGIIYSRQEALMASTGEYIAILDDDDEWVDIDKLKKQVEFLDAHPDYVLVGGGIVISKKLPVRRSFSEGGKVESKKYRPKTDKQIRRTMLLKNNFFTSTVMLGRDAAVKAGGFIADGVDLAEDYDLWLRMGLLGKMYNTQELFTSYAQPSYNKEKFRLFLKKQAVLINKYKKNYSWYYLSTFILRCRIFFGF